MDLIEQFKTFADDFERAYAADNWSLIAPHFTDDAVYYYSDGSEPVSGRQAVLEKLQTEVGALDRKMDQRDLEFLDYSIDGDTVTAIWRARFGIDEVPPLDVHGEEVARYQGGAIAELRSVIYEEGLVAFGGWMAEHGHKL